MGDKVAAIFGCLEKMISVGLVLPRLGVALKLLLDDAPPALLIGTQTDLYSENPRERGLLDLRRRPSVQDFLADPFRHDQVDRAPDESCSSRSTNASCALPSRFRALASIAMGQIRGSSGRGAIARRHMRSSEVLITRLMQTPETTPPYPGKRGLVIPPRSLILGLWLRVIQAASQSRTNASTRVLIVSAFASDARSSSALG